MTDQYSGSKTGEQCDDIAQEKVRSISGDKEIQVSISDGWIKGSGRS